MDTNTWKTRAFGWSLVACTFIYIANNILNVGFEFPGAPLFYALIGLSDGNAPKDGGTAVLSTLQFFFYPAGVLAAVLFSMKTTNRTLRGDAAVMTGITTFIIRVAFWSVVLIGLADALISFLRVEGFLDVLVGEDLAKELGRSRFRAPYFHFPLVILSIIIATRVKSLGFHWLGLLIVVSELLIVITRFVFSYEQAYQGDLVRFWYGALFLFSSAYTLLEDGHVRVDVFYTGFSDRMKGLVNAVGSIILGTALCWTILIFGMWDKLSIINSPIANLEVSQSGFGMYVKFWMAGFLAVFAVTMAVQFASTMLEGVADYRGDPGKRDSVGGGAH